MIALPNGCSRSKINVTPSNWKSNRASIKKDWRIRYRFYDPKYRGTDNWGQEILIQGMNRYRTVEDRQEVTDTLLTHETQRLAEGWNPIEKRFIVPAASNLVTDIDPTTPFIEALKLAEPRVDVVKEVHIDLISIIKYVEKACNVLYDRSAQKSYKHLPVGKIDSKHLLFILEQCQKDNSKMTDKRYNRYIDYLSIIFNTLKTLQAVSLNPTEALDRKKVVKKKRKVLTKAQVDIIDKYWFLKDYYYWRYMHIFFHSGARGTEMRKLRKDSSVDLQKQEFTVVVKKGGQYNEQTRVISSAVLHLWQEVWNEAKDGDYLFGSCLRAGPKPCAAHYVRNKWYDHVQKELGIDVTFYPLKHLHSDLVAKKLSLKHSQEAAGHTSERTAKIYAVNEDERRRDELKGLDISLTG